MAEPTTAELAGRFTETVYTTAQAAELLGVCPERVRQLRRAGQLPGRQTPLGWLFTRSAVLTLQARRTPRIARAVRNTTEAPARALNAEPASPRGATR